MENFEYNTDLIGTITKTDIDQEVQLMDKLCATGMHFIEAVKLLCSYRAHEMLVELFAIKNEVTLSDILEIQESVEAFA